MFLSTTIAPITLAVPKPILFYIVISRREKVLEFSHLVIAPFTYIIESNSAPRATMLTELLVRCQREAVNGIDYIRKR